MWWQFYQTVNISLRNFSRISPTRMFNISVNLFCWILSNYPKICLDMPLFMQVFPNFSFHTLLSILKKTGNNFFCSCISYLWFPTTELTSLDLSDNHTPRHLYFRCLSYPWSSYAPASMFPKALSINSAFSLKCYRNLFGSSKLLDNFYKILLELLYDI